MHFSWHFIGEEGRDETVLYLHCKYNGFTFIFVTYLLIVGSFMHSLWKIFLLVTNLTACTTAGRRADCDSSSSYIRPTPPLSSKASDTGSRHW